MDLYILMQQAPAHITEEQGRDALTKFKGDIVATLTHLWDIKEPMQTSKQQTEEQKKWSNIRAVCDEHDQHMEKHIKKIGGQ